MARGTSHSRSFQLVERSPVHGKQVTPTKFRRFRSKLARANHEPATRSKQITRSASRNEAPLIKDRRESLMR